MAKLLPPVKSSIIKSKSSSLTKVDYKKLLPLTQPEVGKLATQNKKINSDENILIQIEKKVIKIDKLLKDSLILQKKEAETKRRKKETGEFEKKEKELESKKLPKIKGINLPSLPKLGVFDWIKNFIFNTLLGFIAIRLIDHLPKLLKILPILMKAADFIIDFGGKLLDGLVTFIDWGYKAYDATRGFVKNIFGESGVKKFDELSSVLNTFLNLAIIAGMAAAGSGGLGGRGGKGGGAKPRPGQSGKSRVTTSGGRTQGRPDIRNPLRQRPTVTTSGGGRSGGVNIRNPLRARPAITGVTQPRLLPASSTGAKGVLSTVRPFLKRIPLPVVGALIDFGLSVALGENPGRAAFRAIGAGLLGAVGTVVGSAVPFVGNIIVGTIGGIAGDMAGGALYDMFFGGKKPKQKQGKTNKLAGGGRPTLNNRRPITRTLKKKKKQKTSSFIPVKIKPGRNTGGEDEVQKVFPNPEKPKGFFGWLGGLFGGGGNQQQSQPQPQKPKEKIANPQEFLVKSNDVLGKADFFGPFFTLALKSVLGDKPNKLDYLNVGKGLNAWMQTAFKTGPLGFAGGGEVDAKQFFEGEDYISVIAKSVENSVSKEVDITIRDLAKELALKTVSGKENEIYGDGGGGGGGGGGFGGYDESPHGTPGPPVQATPGFNAGKGDKTRKIFLHWTADDHSKNFSNYHTTFLGNGRAIRNRPYDVDGTEHTGGANTNSVGLSIAAMKGGKENKFGSFPPTVAQISAMALEAARLAVGWGWDESTIDRNVRTHGEWERYATSRGILPGAPQRWDLDKLRQSDPMNSGGDKLRKMIKSYFKKLKAGATVDSSGKVIDKGTGSPLAQMSLETATEIVDRAPGGTNISGGNADFWALAAVASLESSNPQGQADVAQAVYNRVASRSNFGQGSNHTIKGHILARGQFQPVRETRGGYDTWSKITDKTTAIAALSAHPRGRNAARMIESAAANIRNAELRKNSAEFVGGRTDFATPTAANKYPGGFGYKTRHGHLYGWYVGPGAIAYGKTNPGPAQAPALGDITISTATIPGSVNLRGGDGKFIQGNSGRSGGVHFHIGTTKPGDGTGVAAAGFNTIKYFLGKKSIFVGRSEENIPSKATDDQIREYIARGQASHRRTELDLQIGGLDGRKNNVPFPLALKGMKYSATDGYGVSADIVGVNAFVGHGRYKPDGSLALQQGTRSQGPLSSGAPDFYAFHGMNKVMSKDGLLKFHKGEYISVTNANSFRLVGNILTDINSIENKSQLIAKAPSIIEKLKSISGYTDYEQPYAEPQVVIIEKEAPVPMPMGGGSSFMIAGGGDIDNIDHQILEMV